MTPLDYPIIENCFGIQFDREIYATYVDENSPLVEYEVTGLNLQYKTKYEPRIFLLQLDTYKWFDGDIYH